MLVKDNDGDFILLTATWTGVKEGKAGIPGTRHQRGQPGTPREHGYCFIQYKKLRSPTKSGYFKYYPNLKSFGLPGMQVNLRHGQIKLFQEDPHLLQNVCVAFSSVLLYLLVQPRPRNCSSEEKKFRKRTESKRTMMHSNY